MTPLLTLDGSGADRGVAVNEMALSPDGTEVAYRLRHYQEHTADWGRHDTLDIAPTSDLSRALEIARGTPGDGLAWSPASHWLTFGLESRVALASADGRSFAWISPDPPAARYPLWVGANEIWFAMEVGDGWQVWRVTVR